MIVLGEDTNIRYMVKGEEIPEKHQLLIKFNDSSALVSSARMYAQLHVSPVNSYNNEYYDIVKEKPSPFSDDFNMKYFEELLDGVRPTTSIKSFLATKQRIPGLGNGTLQDILFNAKIHPKTKIKKLSKEQKKDLFNSIKNTLSEMTEKAEEALKNLYLITWRI
ncbi:Formamidopyrimidine-DNA glycosylase [Candidatus Methanobinarius endosymbioticus]|uniref:Formamidopyrimidine-DNA glycosylase n=1 Tax=Candidatus Methanobinarius endosymbioticus TaxID=2006182 RepID=A0A366MF90_9EURY|nr:Formamidopyrimidine-DNA glycosylase [Candidatus Methanobinarius endosymbioticus]